MNLDFALINRALLNIGLIPITEADKKAGNEAWRTAKEYYLTTMLEALSQVEWTGAKRRRELCPAQMPLKKNADFALVYDLPIDCAKSIEIDDQEYFEAEARLLYTDTASCRMCGRCRPEQRGRRIRPSHRRSRCKAPVRLLYVSNGRRLSDQTVMSAGNARRKLTDDYVTGGDADRIRRHEWGDNILFGGNARRKKPSPPVEDFPDYREMGLEPNFYLYWENLLSAKYALRLTDKPDLSALCFNKAQAIGRAAEVASIANSAAKMKAPPSWQEEMGLR
jgi:hypothetical protein